MLVLSRKLNETIRIGDEVEIKIVEVKGDTVRIGIKAPKALEILRGELIISVSENNNEAINLNADMLAKLTKKS